VIVSNPDTMLIEEYTPNGTFIRSSSVFDTDLEPNEAVALRAERRAVRRVLLTGQDPDV
jgi:hypothetical protein